MQRPRAGVYLRRLPEADHGRYGMAAGHRIVRIVVQRNLLSADCAGARSNDGPLEHSPGGIARPPLLRVRHVSFGAQFEIFGDFHAAVRARRSGQRGANPDRLCQGDLGLVRPPARVGARDRDVGGRAGRFHHAATRPDANRAGGLARCLSDPRFVDARDCLSADRAVDTGAAAGRGRAPASNGSRCDGSDRARCRRHAMLLAHGRGLLFSRDRDQRRGCTCRTAAD